MVMGIVKMINNGFTVAFKSEITTATINEVMNTSKLLLEMAIPGSK